MPDAPHSFRYVPHTGEDVRAMLERIGVASVGGILVAGLFTLTVLPAIVSLFTRGERPQGR